MSWIESLFRPCIDYATRRHVQRKSDASGETYHVLAVWTVMKVR